MKAFQARTLAWPANRTSAVASLAMALCVAASLCRAGEANPPPVTERVKATAERTVDKVEAGAERAAEATKKGVEKAVDATGKALDKAGEAIERTADKTGQAVERTAAKAKQKITKKKPVAAAAPEGTKGGSTDGATH